MNRLIFLFIGLVQSFSITAATFLLSNGVNPKADFATISAAVSGSLQDDTIYVEGTGQTYGNLTLSSPRTIIGQGFFGGSTGVSGESVFGSVTINSGAEGARFVSLRIASVNVNVPADFQRCFFSSSVTMSAVSANFIQCYLTSVVTLAPSSDGAVFNNCLFNYAGAGLGLSDVGVNTVFDQCSFYDGNLSLGSATYSNSIMNTTKVIVTGGQDGLGNALDTEVNLGFPANASTDAELQLPPGSVALTGSVEGDEAGAFGFPSSAPENIYRLSGVPPIPAILSIESASASKRASDLTITVQAKTNN
jgi:hypothetical protein